VGHRVPTRGAVVEVLLPIYLYFSSPEGSVMYKVCNFFLGSVNLICTVGVYKPFCISYVVLGGCIVIPLCERSSQMLYL
jgi:hypothetical protein